MELTKEQKKIWYYGFFTGIVILLIVAAVFYIAYLLAWGNEDAIDKRKAKKSLVLLQEVVRDYHEKNKEFPVFDDIEQDFRKKLAEADILEVMEYFPYLFLVPSREFGNTGGFEKQLCFINELRNNLGEPSPPSRVYDAYAIRNLSDAFDVIVLTVWADRNIGFSLKCFDLKPDKTN